MMYINQYLNDILYPQLKNAGIKYRFIQKIQEDIKIRMLSVLTYWKQETIRKTILFLSLEEALFYEPKAKENVREFVVTAIRNSMLEIAGSDNCAEIKMPEPLSNQQMRQITSEAIKFFDRVKFEELCQELECDFVNVYDVAKSKYPLAWDVVMKLANMSEDVCDYKSEVSEGMQVATLNLSKNDKVRTVVCDGYTLEFDEQLKTAIGEVLVGVESVFYSDCFKMISRNFEKVLHVMQIILENDKIVCTSNYFISTQHLEKRKKILRAAHNTEDVIKNLEKTGSAPRRLRAQLMEIVGGE